MYNDYYYQVPSYSAYYNPSGFTNKSGSFFKGLSSKWSWNGFLTSAGKTLNVINQAIPVFYQVKPIISNAKTMFKVLGAVKDEPVKNNQTTLNNYSTVNNSNTYSNNSNGNDLKNDSSNQNSFNSTTNRNNSYQNSFDSDGTPTFFL